MVTRARDAMHFQYMECGLVVVVSVQRQVLTGDMGSQINHLQIYTYFSVANRKNAARLLK
jgi:hypothetical protein